MNITPELIDQGVQGCTWTPRLLAPPTANIPSSRATDVCDPLRQLILGPPGAVPRRGLVNCPRLPRTVPSEQPDPRSSTGNRCQEIERQARTQMSVRPCDEHDRSCSNDQKSGMRLDSAGQCCVGGDWCSLSLLMRIGGACSLLCLRQSGCPWSLVLRARDKLLVRRSSRISSAWPSSDGATVWSALEARRTASN
jgi:hypothetical protein